MCLLQEYRLVHKYMCDCYDLQYTLAYIVFFISDYGNLFLIILSAVNIEMRVESHFSSRVSKISCVKVYKLESEAYFVPLSWLMLYCIAVNVSKIAIYQSQFVG